MNTHVAASDWIDAKCFEHDYPFSSRTFWLWISQGRLPAYKPSKRKTLVRRSDVEKILEASRAGVDIDRIVNETVSEVLGK
jgi:hypothetical protein